MIQLFKKFLELSFPLKIILGSLFGIIAGPGLLAFISEYATYLYALRLNIRPPLEGIPYLSATVALASLFLSLIAISIFLFTRAILNRMVNLFIWQINNITHNLDELNLTDIKFKNIISNSIQTLKELPAKKALPIIIITAIIFTLITSSIAELQQHIENKNSHINPQLVLFIYFLMVLLSLWRPIINWVVAISFALAFYAISFKFLFNQNYYSDFLKLIKYGGDIPLAINYKDKNKSREDATLLLRTQYYLFLKQQNSDEVIEIALQDIESIIYK